MEPAQPRESWNSPERVLRRIALKCGRLDLGAPQKFDEITTAASALNRKSPIHAELFAVLGDPDAVPDDALIEQIAAICRKHLPQQQPTDKGGLGA